MPFGRVQTSRNFEIPPLAEVENTSSNICTPYILDPISVALSEGGAIRSRLPQERLRIPPPPPPRGSEHFSTNSEMYISTSSSSLIPPFHPPNREIVRSPRVRAFVAGSCRCSTIARFTGRYSCPAACTVSYLWVSAAHLSLDFKKFTKKPPRPPRPLIY